MKSDLVSLQETILCIAAEIKRICDMNDINYSLVDGTLLGAVRHNGFIPWDDDMDFAMDRRNYTKFLEACKTDLNPRYELLNWHTNEYFGDGFSKIIVKDTIAIEEGKEYVKYPQCIFADIFPFDRIPDSKLMRKRQKILTYTCIRLLQQKDGAKREHKNIVKKAIYSILKLFSVFFSHKSLVSICEKHMMMYQNFCCERITNIAGVYGYEKTIVPSEYFDNYIELKFENTEFKSIAEFHSYLKKIYGNYMQLPPLEQRHSHGINIVKGRNI